jgi:hypothetical protein
MALSRDQTTHCSWARTTNQQVVTFFLVSTGEPSKDPFSVPIHHSHSHSHTVDHTSQRQGDTAKRSVAMQTDLPENNVNVFSGDNEKRLLPNATVACGGEAKVTTGKNKASPGFIRLRDGRLVGSRSLSDGLPGPLGVSQHTQLAHGSLGQLARRLGSAVILQKVGHVNGHWGHGHTMSSFH